MSARVRLWLPWLGTIALGLFVALRTDLSGISRAVLGASPAWLALAVVLYAADRVVAAAKWRLLFTADRSTDLGLARALSIYLRAGFLGSLLPSTVGVDAIRIHLVRREAGGSLPHVVGSVLVERWLGVLGLTVLAGIGLILWAPGDGWGGIGVGLLVASGVVVAGSVLLVASRFRPGPARRQGWVRRVLGFIHDLQVSLREYADRPGITFAVFAIAFAQQLILVFINWILALALGLPLPLSLFLGLWPLVLIAIRLPLSVLGFGVREAMLYGYFVSAGLPAVEAVTLGLLSGALDLVFIGAGGLLTLRASEVRIARIRAEESG